MEAETYVFPFEKLEVWQMSVNLAELEKEQKK